MRRLGCRGAAAGLLSALPRHSSCSIVPIPMPFSSPISIPGAVLEYFSLVLVSTAALELAPLPSTRLLQPSVRGVVDLGVMAFGHHPLPSPSLCGRVTLSVGVHSVYAPVGESGRLLASFDLREAYIPVPVHPASCPFLRFLFRDTVYQLQVLYFGLSHGSAGLPLRHGSCFSYTPFSGYPYASIPRHMAGPVFGIVIHPRSSNLIPSQVVQCLWVVFVSTSFRASPSVDRISRRQSATAVFLSCA